MKFYQNMSRQFFSTSLLLRFFSHHHQHHRDAGGLRNGAQPFCAFSHSCILSTTIIVMMVALSIVRSLSRALCLSVPIEYASAMHAQNIQHTQMRTKETSRWLKEKKQHSRRRSCSYQFVASRLVACKNLSI